MEGIFFWLAPVLLAVVLTLLAVAMSKKVSRPPLLIIEPIGTLIRKWQVARAEPSSSVLQTLRLNQGTLTSSDSLTEQILRNTALPPVKEAPKNSRTTLLEHASFSGLGEQFIVEVQGKRQSIIVGIFSTIAGQLRSDKELVRYQGLAATAESKGYLVLAIGSAFIHGSKNPSTHSLEGIIFLEPVFEGFSTKTEARLLSVAPATFLAATFGSRVGLAVDSLAVEALGPKFAEAEIERAKAIGGSNLKVRYQAIRVWQQSFNCQLVSTNPEDRELPLPVASKLP